MLVDALKFLADLATKGKTPQLLADEPDRARYAIDGEVVTVEKSPRPRDHTVRSVDDAIALANRFRENDYFPVVWYDEGRVCIVIDDNEHRAERATLPLSTSQTYDTIEGLGDWLDQKAFVRLLRIDLGPRVLEPRLLLEPARRLEFENGQVTSGYVGRSDESLGRTIKAKVQGAAGDLPETVTLYTRVYSTAGEADRYGIECAVEVDPGMGKLRLVPLPDETDRVRQQAVASIAERLRAGLAEGIPCYYGTP